MTALSTSDPCSFSNPEDNQVTNLDLHLEVDFEEHVLRGSVDLTVERKSAIADMLILDTRDVKIEKVTDKQTGQNLKFSLSEPVLCFGSKLEIRLPAVSEKSCVVSVHYETSPQCSALQWLKPEQTAGKEQPYLFSQCQAIHCRSMIPCQDSPAVKCTYTAEIVAPSRIVILMSAVKGAEIPSSDPTKRIHTFCQKVAVPTYLIAIVGGDLEYRSIGPRSKVWSEKEMVEKAEYEFAETEAMLQTAEKLLGPYVWGQYDLLVLPPSFPYGGMENPCLTFVTPTLLAGDRSLADVVAHEITHSWTGNLVTNNTFEHFWLNEGHTVFVERKIMGHLKTGERFRSFMSASGWQTLQETVKTLGESHPYTKLIPDLKGVDPDDAFSSVPYEKGSAFLFYLESILGGPDAFEPFLKAYIEKFKHQSINTQDWKDFLYSYFQGEDDRKALNSVDWEGWFYGVGMPPVKPIYDTSMAAECEALAAKWCDAADDKLDQFTVDDLKEMLSVQRVEFLALIFNKPALSLTKVQKMEELYKFNAVRNSEIRFMWLRVCIRAKWEDVIPRALQFVTEQGRMKFTRPVYRDLYAWETSREAAINNFRVHRAEMHSTTASLVAKDLKLPD